MTPAVQWLEGVVTCPEDGAGLRGDAESLRCETCGRTYATRDSVLDLLPDAFRDLSPDAVAVIRHGSGWPARWSGGRATTRSTRYARRARTLPCADAHASATCFATCGGAWAGSRSWWRWAPAGAGRCSACGLPPTAASATWPPTFPSGRCKRAPALWVPARPPCAARAGTWPFAEDSVDVVLVFGVLHHLPDWRGALGRACQSVRPGGYILLHEVIWKPRILASRREALPE